MRKQELFEQKRIHYKVWNKLHKYIHERNLNVSIRNGNRYIVVKFIDKPVTENIKGDIVTFGRLLKITSGIKYHRARYEAIYPILNSQFQFADERITSIQMVNDEELTDKNLNPYRNAKRDIYD